MLNMIDQKIAFSKRERLIHSLAQSNNQPVDEVRAEFSLQAGQLKKLLHKGIPDISGFYIVFKEEDGSLNRLSEPLYFNSTSSSWSKPSQCDYHISESDWDVLIERKLQT